MNAHSKTSLAFALIAPLLASTVIPAMAADKSQPLSVRNSFRVGSSGVTCTAQNAPADKRLDGLFDRSYRLSCRDAAGAVGSLIAVRRDVATGAEPTGLPGVTLSCGDEGAVNIEAIGRVRAVNCRDQSANVEYKRYALRRGRTTYFVEGLAGYDPALRLALASVVADTPLTGEIRVATTEVSDPAAFARVQAGQLDRLGARDEGYLRNNGGRFAESSEFFEA
ncbi:MAG: CHAT domain-containing protein, partial [Novosphingobium sp.]